MANKCNTEQKNNELCGRPIQTLEESLLLTDWRSPLRAVMGNVVKIKEGPFHWANQRVVLRWACSYHCQFINRVWCDEGSCSSYHVRNGLVAEQPEIVVGAKHGFKKLVRTKKNIMNLFRCFKLQLLARHQHLSFLHPFCIFRHTGFWYSLRVRCLCSSLQTLY